MGRGATLALGVFALLAGQLAALLALTWWFGRSIGHLPDFSGDGAAITLVIAVSTPVEVPLLALFARRTGASAAAYLGLIWPRRGEVVFGVAAPGRSDRRRQCAELAARARSGHAVSDRHLHARRARAAGCSGCGSPSWSSTPIGEEILFRGFLFRGWLQSPRDAWPVIVVTSLLWALIHVQYDWYVIGQIFAFGLLLGWMRWATGSTLLTILLHGLINSEGMFETFVALKWLH